MAELDLAGLQPSKTIPIGDFKLVLVEEDDTFGGIEFMAWLTLRALRVDKVGPIDLLPLEDVITYLELEAATPDRPLE